MRSDFTETNPDKGTETFNLCNKPFFIHDSLQKQTPIRGRKLLTKIGHNRKAFLFTEINPDKGTETT